MSILRHLGAALVNRWGELPRSDRVRVAILAVALPVAALLAWATASPSDDLTASMRSLTDKRAYAEEPAGQETRVPFDHGTGRRAGKAAARPSAKMTFESEPDAGVEGASGAVSATGSAAGASSQWGGRSADKKTLFQTGAREQVGETGERFDR